MEYVSYQHDHGDTDLSGLPYCQLFQFDFDDCYIWIKVLFQRFSKFKFIVIYSF
jgi:hypothetical protein